MPLYAFGCGEHVTDRLVPVGTDIVACGCGRSARRVFGQSIAIKRGPSASEFKMPKAMRDAIDETIGYKHEAQAARAEAEANGLRA